MPSLRQPLAATKVEIRGILECLGLPTRAPPICPITRRRRFSGLAGVREPVTATLADGQEPPLVPTPPRKCVIQSPPLVKSPSESRVVNTKRPIRRSRAPAEGCPFLGKELNPTYQLDYGGKKLGSSAPRSGTDRSGQHRCTFKEPQALGSAAPAPPPSHRDVPPLELSLYVSHCYDQRGTCPGESCSYFVHCRPLVLEGCCSREATPLTQPSGSFNFP